MIHDGREFNPTNPFHATGVYDLSLIKPRNNLENDEGKQTINVPAGGKSVKTEQDEKRADHEAVDANVWLGDRSQRLRLPVGRHFRSGGPRDHGVVDRRKHEDGHDAESHENLRTMNKKKHTSRPRCR